MSKRKPTAMFDAAALNSPKGNDWLDKLEAKKAEAKPSQKPKAILPVGTEHDLQVACLKWARLQHPCLLLHAIPNGGLRHPRIGAKLKAEGALAGAADLLAVHNGFAHYIEMKRPGGTQHATQKEFAKRAKEAGACYWLCYSLEEFQACIEAVLTWTEEDHLYYG